MEGGSTGRFRWTAITPKWEGGDYAHDVITSERTPAFVPLDESQHVLLLLQASSQASTAFLLCLYFLAQKIQSAGKVQGILMEIGSPYERLRLIRGPLYGILGLELHELDIERSPIASCNPGVVQFSKALTLLFSVAHLAVVGRCGLAVKRH
ncbi:hypothetical protein Mapa_009991 [Marchantia paleacea]|nr:hypothetical protein Mapa_009991 [Marchantia paleacea]